MGNYESNKKHELSRRLQQAKYRKDNREKVLASKKKSYRKNKEKYQEYGKKLYSENREKIKEERRIFRLANLEKVRAYKRVDGRKPSRRLSQCRARAKALGYDFDIDLESYKKILSSPCHYCGSDISNNGGTNLDRIDNSKGYTLDNVLPACWVCNKTRADVWSVAETKIMIQTALKFRKAGIDML